MGSLTTPSIAEISNACERGNEMSRTSNSDLTEDYLRWLEPQLRDEHDNPGKTYWDLLNVMFEKEFTWSISMDENRAVDGLDLRVEFAHEIHVRPTSLWKSGSVFVSRGSDRAFSAIGLCRRRFGARVGLASLGQSRIAQNVRPTLTPKVQKDAGNHGQSSSREPTHPMGLVDFSRWPGQMTIRPRSNSGTR